MRVINEVYPATRIHEKIAPVHFEPAALYSLYHADHESAVIPAIHL